MSSSPSAFRRLKLLRRAASAPGAAKPLLKDGSGATAVEFALVAAPLIFMLFSIIELGLVYMLSATLENATSDVARTIRTGAVQTAGTGSANNTRDAICAKLYWLQSQCTANLSVDVRTFSQFASPTIPSPIKNGVFDSTVLTYNIGAQGDIVLVRAFYRWTLFTPFLKGGLQNLNNGVTMLTAVSMFKNEPY